MAYRLMLVDDHPVVRQGLRSFLSRQDDLEIVAEAGSLAEARERAAQVSGELDLVLLDIELPDGSGLSLIRELLDQPHPPRVLVLTSFLEREYVREALRRGANGYLIKHAGTQVLLDGVRAVLRGEMPLDPAAARLLAQDRSDPVAELTPRERQVLELLAEGLSNRDISQRLNVREKTVKSHLGNVFAKLGLRDRTQAALWAREHGLQTTRR
ncbi:MAG TPA: response regulator transcription factor [Trueperaceae bacterium]